MLRVGKEWEAKADSVLATERLRFNDPDITDDDRDAIVKRLELAEGCVGALMFAETFGHIKDPVALKMAKEAIYSWDNFIGGPTKLPESYLDANKD